MKSTRMCSAQRRSSMSFSDSAGTLTATPGRLMPLWLLTLPPTSTRVVTSVVRRPSTTASRTLPSSIRIGSPGVDVAGQPVYVVPQIVASPGDVAGGDRELRRPASSLTGPSANVAEPDLRALQVGEDADAVAARVGRLPHQAGRPASWSSWVPWLRFSRATSMPASTSARIFSGVSTAGPRVQTILALRTTLDPSGLSDRSQRAAADGRMRSSGPRSDDQRALGRRDRRGQRGRPGEVRCRPRPPRPGPRRSPRRSATGRARRRRRRRRRRRSRHVRRVAGDVAALVEVDAELLDQALAARGPVKPIASSTSSAGISRSVPVDLGWNAVLSSTSTSRSARTLPSSSPRNSWVDTAYTRSPPSSWAEETRKIIGYVGQGWSGGPRPRRLRHDLQLRDRRRALAVRGAEAVRAGVAAADDHDVLAGRR